jgi:hypothetical protein
MITDRIQDAYFGDGIICDSSGQEVTETFWSAEVNLKGKYRVPAQSGPDPKVTRVPVVMCPERRLPSLEGEWFLKLANGTSLKLLDLKEKEINSLIEKDIIYRFIVELLI